MENHYYTEDEHNEPCQRLGDALVQMKDHYLGTMEALAVEDPRTEGTVEYIKSYILDDYGIDVDQDEQILEFACRLAGKEAFPIQIRLYSK